MTDSLPDTWILPVPRFEQPDDVTCGPTSLLQILRFHGDPIPFPQLLERTPRNPDGGTLAVYLGLVALQLGYPATVHSLNLQVFDPTWSELPPDALTAKLRARARGVADPKLTAACGAYADFLEAGGQVRIPELTPALLQTILHAGHPLLCGLSATYLYGQPRVGDDNEDDDVLGEPLGHFVVVCGYEDAGETFLVRDPGTHVPFSADGRYRVPARRLLHAILLGIVSYDAVLLEISPNPRTHTS